MRLGRTTLAWWWHPRSWGFGAIRLRPEDGWSASLWSWVAMLGPLEIRRGR